MAETYASPVWLFERFVPGAVIGETRFRIDESMTDAWAIVSGKQRLDPGSPCPAGLLVAAMMRGYTRIVTPRPPGNVHAGQTLRFGKEAKVGDEIDMQVSCASKAIRNEKRWLEFDVRLLVKDNLCLVGRMRLLWAA